MPAETVHIAIGARVAGELALSPALRPAFLLGAVATDVNNLMGWPRERTHFWPGADGAGASGALRLLAAHPGLAAGRLRPAERAVVAGYLCHLITDEQEILTLGRPYFSRLGAVSSPGYAALRLASLIVVDGAVEAGAPDRLRAGVGHLRRAPGLHLPDGLLPFAPLPDVRRWVALTLAVAGLPAGQPRVQPHRRDVPLSPAEGRHLEELMDAVRRVLPEGAAGMLVDRSVEQSVACAGAYLAGRPVPAPLGTVPLPGPP